MKYLVCSDIHGDESAFYTLLDLKERLNCDAMISAGDFTPTFRMEAEAFNIDFRTVMGNMDIYHEFSMLSTIRNFITFTHSGRTVVVTHGDRYSPSLFSLKDGDIFISGHTHQSMLEKEDGIILFNPGSPSRPRDGRASFGILGEDYIKLLSFPSASPFKELSL